MSKQRLLKIILFAPILALCFFPSRVSASSFTTTGPSDFYFNIEEPKVLDFRTYAWEYGIDSMLWLYLEDGQNSLLVAANDDHYGLDSRIVYQAQPGIYRLRTGVCCGNPEAWYGTSYVVEINQEPYSVPTQETTTTSAVETTIPETTTTTIETTTTTSTTTTSTTIPETTTTTTTTTTQETTTTVSTTIPVTTTTIEQTTTTTTEVPVATTARSTPTETTVLQQAEQQETKTPTTTVPVTIPQTTTTTIPAITENLSQEQAVLIVTNAAVLETISKEEASSVFSSLDVSALTEEQAKELIAAVQDAPEEVREAFEEEINVFDGATDSYVPLGSTVPVGTRRVIIGVSAVLVFAAPPATGRRN